MNHRAVIPQSFLVRNKSRLFIFNHTYNTAWKYYEFTIYILYRDFFLFYEQKISFFENHYLGWYSYIKKPTRSPAKRVRVGEDKASLPFRLRKARPCLIRGDEAAAFAVSRAVHDLVQRFGRAKTDRFSFFAAEAFFRHKD